MPPTISATGLRRSPPPSNSRPTHRPSPRPPTCPKPCCLALTSPSPMSLANDLTRRGPCVASGPHYITRPPLEPILPVPFSFSSSFPFLSPSIPRFYPLLCLPTGPNVLDTNSARVQVTGARTVRPDCDRSIGTAGWDRVPGSNIVFERCVAYCLTNLFPSHHIWLLSSLVMIRPLLFHRHSRYAISVSGIDLH